MKKLKALFHKFIEKGHLPDDLDDEKLRKSSLLIVALPLAIMGLIWGGMCFYFGLHTSGFIPFRYGILSLISILRYSISKKYNFFRFSQIILILTLPFLLQMSLGGIVPSGLIIMWAFISPIGAMAFYSVRQSLGWYVTFILLVLFSYIFNTEISLYFNRNLTEGFVVTVSMMNIIGI